MGKARDYWRRRHAGYGRRGQQPPDVERTRLQEVRRLEHQPHTRQLRTERLPVDEDTGRQLWIHPPGLTVVKVERYEPRDAEGEYDILEYEIQLDQTWTDDQGRTWLYADWCSFRIMSLCRTI